MYQRLADIGKQVEKLMVQNVNGRIAIEMNWADNYAMFNYTIRSERQTIGTRLPSIRELKKMTDEEILFYMFIRLDRYLFKREFRNLKGYGKIQC